MEGTTVYLNLSIGEAARTICAQVEKAGRSSRMADCHEMRRGKDLCGMVMVFEKYYVRAGGRVSMTVALDNLEGRTRAHWVVTGGSGIMNNTGDTKVAAEKYSSALRKALFPHIELD